MAREVLLKIYEGERANEEFIFNEPGAYLIGRSAQCALQIAKMRDKKISRGHLLFILGMSGVRIRDLGSRNGTFLNGVRMDPGEIGDVPEEMSASDSILNPGDRVTMGDTVWGIEFIIPELSQTKLEQASQKLQERKASLVPSVSQATPPPQVVDVHPKKMPSPKISFASKLKKPEEPTVKKKSATSPIPLTPNQKTPETSSVTPPVKRKTSMSTISVDEERETDKNPAVNPKPSPASMSLESKSKKPEPPPIKQKLSISPTIAKETVRKPFAGAPPEPLPVEKKTEKSPISFDAKPETPDAPPVKRKLPEIAPAESKTVTVPIASMAKPEAVLPPPVESKTKVSTSPVSLGAKAKEPATVESKPSKPTISVDEERETDKNPPVNPKPATAPILLGAKQKKSEASTPVKPKPALRSPALKEAFSFDKDKANAESISDQDVYDKLGTAEETVSMEPEEFDNLDDLVFRPPEKKTNKRTTNFKIKSPSETVKK